MAAVPQQNMFDQEDIEELEVEFDHEHMRKEYVPSGQEKIKSFTVACLIINRSVGSGIFATPAKVIQGTNSIGVSLIFWTLGGLLALCGTLVWIEFGLSIPREIVDGKERAVPRSGGEKNYVGPTISLPTNYTDVSLARVGLAEAQVPRDVHVRYCFHYPGKPVW